MVFPFRLSQYWSKVIVEITPYQCKPIQIINSRLRKSRYWKLLGVVPSWIGLSYRRNNSVSMQTYSNNQFQATEVSILEAFGRSTELNWSQHFLLERYQFFIAISESTKMNPYTSSPVILSKKEKKALQNKKYREYQTV